MFVYISVYLMMLFQLHRLYSVESDIDLKETT